MLRQEELEKIGELLKSHYFLDSPVIHLISVGNSNVYSVDCDSKRFVLKIYEDQERRRSLLLKQLAFFEFASGQKVNCARPVRSKTNALLVQDKIGQLDCVLVLLTKGLGESRDEFTPKLVRSTGIEIARLHMAAIAYPSISFYPKLAIDEVRNVHLSVILTEAKKYGVDISPIQVSFELIENDFLGIDPGRCLFSIYHGDPHFTNMTFNHLGIPTLFDFDDSRLGPAVFDFAFICLLAKSPKNIEKDLSSHYQNGYNSIKPLNDYELSVIPTLMALFHFIAMGAHCRYQNGKYPKIDKQYLLDNLAALVTYGDRSSFYTADNKNNMKLTILGGTLE